MGFWLERRILVTGGTGFVGAWLVRRLVDLGAEVVCLVRDAMPGSLLQISSYAGRVVTVRGELEDYHLLERVLSEYEIESIFHLGAQTIVGTASRSPMATFEANIRGTWNVLEAARAHQDTVSRVVVASTDKAYGDHAGLPYTEDMALMGRHPYDVSKSCADLIAQAYARSYGLPVGVVRCGNVYGGGDLNYNRIIPGTIRSVLRGERPVIRSDGSYTRDYLYVEDAIQGYLALAEALSEALRGEAFNFSGETPTAVIDVVRLILALANREDLEPVVLGGALAEIPHQRLATEKAQRVLGWRPRHSLEDGLRETVDWYRTRG